MGRKKKRSESYPLFDLIEKKEERAKEMVQFYTRLKILTDDMKKREDILRIKYLCPAGSFLDKITSLFWDKTSVATSLVFWGGLCSMGTYLTMRKIPIEIGSQIIFPNLWILAVADSGWGKTYTDQRLSTITGDRIERIPGDFTSKAAIIQELKQTTGKGLIVRDEVGQQLKMMKNPAYLTLKDAMLSLYDGSLKHITKKDGQIVLDDLAMSYFGCTVPSTLSTCLSAEDLVDGFLQRFVVYLTNKKERNMENVLYEILHDEIDDLKNVFDLWTTSSIKIKKFILSNEAKEAWIWWYKKYFKEEHESYYRRYMFSGIKYAAIYNSMLNKNGIISLEDMEWAIRLTEISLDSLYQVMEDYMGFNKWENSLTRIVRYIKDHPTITARSLQLNLKIKADELFYILQNMYVERYDIKTLPPDIQRWFSKKLKHQSKKVRS